MAAEETNRARESEADGALEHDAGEHDALDVFISCSPLDRALGVSTRRALGSFGVTSWLHPAEGQVEEAMNALSRAQVMVLIFSEHTNTCSRVRREAERAVARNLAIIPFRITDVPLSPSMEYFISTTHWFDALDGPPHTHLDRLCDAVRRLLLASQRAQQIVDGQAASQAAITWTASDLEHLERLLAACLGPVAKILVREALPLSNSKPDLARRLARQIDREGERETFLLACRRAEFLAEPNPATPAPGPPRRGSIFGATPPAPAGEAASGSKAAAGLSKANRLWPWKKGGQPAPEAARISLEERIVDEAFVESASLLLARHLGPVARVLAARTARTSPNARAMVSTLAQSIPSERERNEFVRAAELL